jgi:lysophospholipase L1-like esterase
MPLSKKSVVIALLLLFSIAINIVLFRLSFNYYRLYLKTTLYPYGPNHDVRSQKDYKSLSSSLPKVLMVGDSRARAWPKPQLSEHYTYTNIGYSGHTTAQALGRLRQQIESLRPDVVVIQVGINDMKTISLLSSDKDSIVSNCKNNIKMLVSVSLANNAYVIVSTIIPVGNLPIYRLPLWTKAVQDSLEECNRFIQSLQSDRVMVLNTKPILEGSDGVVLPDYQRDFLHLNPNGYQSLNRYLRPILTEKLGFSRSL